MQPSVMMLDQGIIKWMAILVMSVELPLISARPHVIFVESVNMTGAIAVTQAFTLSHTITVNLY